MIRKVNSLGEIWSFNSLAFGELIVPPQGGLTLSSCYLEPFILHGRPDIKNENRKTNDYITIEPFSEFLRIRNFRYYSSAKADLYYGKVQDIGAAHRE